MKRIKQIVLMVLMFVAIGLLMLPGAAMAAQCTNVDRAILSWDQPDSRTNYIEIHRADGACTAGALFSYQRSIPGDSVTADDTNVVSGQTYCWELFGFTNTGERSGPSNTAECAIPFPFRAPQNLRVK